MNDNAPYNDYSEHTFTIAYLQFENSRLNALAAYNAKQARKAQYIALATFTTLIIVSTLAVYLLAIS